MKQPAAPVPTKMAAPTGSAEPEAQLLQHEPADVAFLDAEAAQYRKAVAVLPGVPEAAVRREWSGK